MKEYRISLIGVLFFLLGLNLLLISWYITYPISLTDLNEITFTQFHPLIWPGIVFSLIGLFLTGYYSQKNSVKAICASLIPIILYVHVFYYSYISSSDSGAVKSMFEVFHKVGIDSSFVHYFQYPTYFTINEITSEILRVDVSAIALIFFILYGLLLGLYLYLFLFNITKKNKYQIAILGIILYFTAMFSYLNYQWVPQTLALVFFFLLILTINREEIEYKLFNLIVFIAFVFTHAFIPVIFLFFYGLYIIKKKQLSGMFLLMSSIYISVLIFYTTYYFPAVVDAFKESIYGFGGEYSATISGSFKETTSFFDQLISTINRIRIPITLLIITVGFIINMIKKRINYLLISLAIAGGFYLALGTVYSVLGLRALQIMIVALVVGISFYITKWKKPTLIFVTILLILSVSGPMRSSYNQTLFQLNQEENACNFLATTIPVQDHPKIAISQVNWGYYSNIYQYLYNIHPTAERSSSVEFYNIFNLSMKKNNYVIYNTNLGKEIISNGLVEQNSSNFSKILFLNNKIYECGKTIIEKGT